MLPEITNIHFKINLKGQWERYGRYNYLCVGFYNKPNVKYSAMEFDFCSSPHENR
jgi:hypothetical protein